MPRHVPEIRCLLISPGDVKRERDALSKMEQDWNGQIGKALNARLELVRWESHSTPDLSGKHPQKIINSQIVDDCDFGLAVFWTRVGTPTDTHLSGSIEEIEKLLSQNKRVMVYFSKKGINPDSLIIEQFTKLREIRDQFRSRGLIAEYKSNSDLIKQVQNHITLAVSELLSNYYRLNSTQSSMASQPDVRVKVRRRVMNDNMQKTKMLEIEVQNHSSLSVFMSALYIRGQDKEITFLIRNALEKELLSGRRYTYNVHEKIFQSLAPDKILEVGMRDEIEREYKFNDPKSIKVIEEFCKPENA
jgi:hypothetical protein